MVFNSLTNTSYQCPDFNGTLMIQSFKEMIRRFYETLEFGL